MWTDFSVLLYPVVVAATLLGLFLGIHLACQYFLRVRPDKKNVIRGLEIFFIALSTYPFFLLGYASDPFLYWVKSVISLPLIFFVPGFLIYTLLSGRLARLPWIPGFTEVIFLQVLISTLISGCIGLALAQSGIFSLFLVDLILISICVIIIGIIKPSWSTFQFPRPHSGKTSYVLIAILFLALALFFHPFPWILGGRDPGVYVNTGVNIANTGAIVIHDPLLANMDSKIQALYYQMETRPDILAINQYKGIQFPGFYITDAQTGEIIPQFFYLWPVWIALFYSMFGLEIGLYVTPVFALLSVLSIYLVGKHVYHTNAGLIAAFILVLNFAQIWYARYPTSEIFTMFIIFSGIFAFLIFMRTSSTFYSCLAAVCFGELLLTRIDSVLLFIPPLAYIICSGIFGKFKKEHLAFLIPFILLGMYALVTALVISAPYTFDVMKNQARYNISPADLWLFIGFIGLILSMLIITMIYLQKKSSALLQRISAIFFNIFSHKQTIIFIQIIVAITLTGYVIYNYFIRPSGLIESDAYNLVKLSWYTAGLVGMSATVCGIVISIRKKPYRNSVFFLSIFGIFTVYQIFSSNISPDHPWWVRRYLPIVIPSMIICMGCFMAWLCSRKLFLGRYWTLRCGVACTLLLLIIVPQGISDSAIIFHTEYNNAISDLNNIAEKLNPDGIIIYKKNYYTEKIATPLNYIYNRTIVKYTPSSASVNTLLNWTESEKTVYLLDVSDPNDIIAYSEANKFTYDIQWTTLHGMSFENYYNYIIIPQKPRVEQHILNILILNGTDSTENMVFLTGNWYDLESWNGIPTRWMSNNATITFHSDENHIVNLTFNANSFYKPRKLEIFSGDTYLTRQTIPSSSFGKISFQIPVESGENSVSLYVPEGCQRPIDITNLKNKDTRCLSIAIQNVTISQQSYFS